MPLGRGTDWLRRKISFLFLIVRENFVKKEKLWLTQLIGSIKVLLSLKNNRQMNKNAR